jgi:hypothetical protein
VGVEADRPGLAVEDQQRLAILEAVVLLLAVDVLQAVDEPVVDDALLVPETFGKRWVLVVDVLEDELVLLASDCVGGEVRSMTKLIREFSLSISSLYPPKTKTWLSFKGAHPLQLSSPNSPWCSIVGSTSAHKFPRML